MATTTLRGLTLGAGRPRIIVPLTGTTPAQLRGQIERVRAADCGQGPGADVLEWRIDLLDDALDEGAVLEAAGTVRAAAGPMPVLATFRTADEGGATAIGPAAYAALLTAVVASGAIDAVDVEVRRDEAAGREVQAAAAAHGVRTVLSNHDFEATPDRAQIVDRLAAMEERGADIAKIAVMPRAPADVLTLLAATEEFVRERARIPVITMSMGGAGLVSRLAGELVGSCATFATVGAASAPGQIPLAELAPVLDLLHAHSPA